MSSSNQSDQDTFEQEPQIPRRGRTPSIIVQTLNLNAQGGPCITESIELNGDDDLDNLNQNSNSNTTNDSPARRLESESEREVINQIAEQLRDCSTTDETSNNNNHTNNNHESSSALGSTSSLYNNNSPLRNFRQPPDPRPPPSVIGNRRLSLNIGSTAPRRLSLNVDSLPSFATAASLSQTSTPGQSPTNTSGNATGSLRNKVSLQPGYSLMGWINLSKASKDLAGFNGKRFDVTPEELAKHNKEDDCWVALKDNVYNVTRYLKYHPGGVDELMKAAGTDATDLFNEVHLWVNFESILEKCLVGPYKLSNNNTTPIN